MGNPYIVGLGGTTRSGSTSERALRFVLAAAEEAGAAIRCFAAGDLVLPLYDPSDPDRSAAATALIEALRTCDGVVISSPGYHGSVSGLVKNALDYTEDLRDDERPYFDGRAVGLVACAAGWQAANSTLAALRSVAHALRGWPTPLGVALNTLEVPIDASGRPGEVGAASQLALLGRQVVDFAVRAPVQAVR